MKYLYLLLVLIYIVSCNESHDNNYHQHNETQMHSTDNHHKLVLNNGEKWQADVTTNEAIGKMRIALDNFKSEENYSIESYQQLGGEMQQYYSELVSKCTMKGPEHDQLHVFLEILQPKIRELKAVENRSEGEELLAETETLISDYYDYFK